VTVTEFDSEALKPFVERAFIYAIMREEGKLDEGVAGGFADAMEEIVQMGPRAVHVALCGWCGLILEGFAEDQGVPARGGFWGLDVVDDETGGARNIDDMGDPAVRDAMRIVTCFGNKDHDTIAAIVETAWNDGGEALVDLLFAAVRIAAQMAMHMAEARGE
jgi:hypothetical protein